MDEQGSPKLLNQALEYPFEERWSPVAGKPFEVGIIRDSNDSWTIVDAGYDSQECKDIWLQVFNQFLVGKTVNKIIITHFHPDHIGLGAWLARKLDAPILISKGEFQHYDKIINRDANMFRKTTLSFAKKIGLDDEIANSFAYFFGASNKPDEGRVKIDMCEYVEDGDIIDINGREWRVVSGNGHSPEHSCLYCQDLEVLISGDQAIARISSNVSVYPSEPDANPLEDWLKSCAKLRDTIPVSTLILPSHQEPFIGINRRMQALIDEHQADLNKLADGLISPKRVVDARKILFDRKLNQVQTVLAIGETLAHLNYLLFDGRIQVEYKAGVAYYQRK